MPAHALSATTAQTITGTEPYLLLSDGVTKLTNVNELLGFSMPNRDGTAGTEQIDASMVGTVLIAPAGMKYQDVATLITADGSVHNVAGVTVGDDDGDASLVANTSAIGQMKATWYNGGKQVTNLNQTLSDCGGPYTLKIEIPVAVSANTAYGAPSSKPYGAHAGVTYTFTANSPGICYLQPTDMTIHTGTEGVNIKYAAGYNPDVWEYDGNLPAAQHHRGFRVDSGFPSTGFNKAIFSVIGSGSDQSQYRCSSSDDGGKILLAGAASSSLGANCQVTYNVGTRAAFTAGGTPTIHMEYNNGSTWVQIDSYTIPTPELWARIVGSYRYNSDWNFVGNYPAATACDGSFKQSGIAAQAAAGALFFIPAEFTNVPKAAVRDGRFSRDLRSFSGEWGNLMSYKGSGWEFSNAYWTGESQRLPSGQFSAGPLGGFSSGDPSNPLTVVACRD